MCQPNMIVVRRNRGLLAAGLLALGIAPLGCSAEDPANFSTSGTAGGATTGSGGSGGTTVTSTSEGGTGGATTATTTATTGGSGGGTGGTGGGAPETFGFPAKWQDGTDCANETKVQVWKYSDDTFILRQSLCTNFEGPFIYVLFGQDKVFVQDTGTGHANTATAVMGVVDKWLTEHGKASIDVVVTHSHSHGDHVGGDGFFKGLPGVTVVGTNTSDVQSFFGFDSWPDQAVTYDLGGRVLDVVAIPGHQSAHIAVYDRELDLLLTGDTLYPGRLYIKDWQAYRASVQRLKSFVDAGNPVTWVLGTHIEMNTSGDDYSMGSDYHQNEHALQLEPAILNELFEATQAMGNSPSYQAHPSFIIYPL
jgi:hydroxyacylglutathione hydrolase